MKKITAGLLTTLILLHFLPLPVFSQGSWNPTGADLSFPRTLLDSLAVPVVRATLGNPEILPLYQSAWTNAVSEIPSGNSTDEDRITRAMIAKEGAFCLLMDRKAANGIISPLTVAENDSLIRKSRGLLENMNTNVGFQQGWVFYQEWQHRSKELISYLVAYDLLRGAGLHPDSLARARDSLTRFTANLYHRAMDTYTIVVLPVHFFSFQVNNHSIMTASALGLAAVVLNDNQSTDADFQPQNWINAGMWNLDNTLWMQGGTYPRVSEPDTLAGYAEGPAYFNYAFQNAFPFIRAMGNFLPMGNSSYSFNSLARQIPNPWYDQRYDFLYDWINKIRMPDGSLPAIHDCQVGFGTTITALSGKPAFNLVNPGFTPNDSFIRTQYIAANVGHGAITDSLFQPLPEAGSLVFRSSWGTGAIYMHFIAQHGIALTGAKSHHQGDAGSFSMFAGGQLLALDPGYPGAAQSSVENKPTDHNLVLVNGNGPNPPNGEFVNTATNTAYIENCFSTSLLDYGEIRTSYFGASITRKTLFINHRYFMLGDFITSTATNDYTFQLQGNGLAGALPSAATGAFYPDFTNSRFSYQRDSVHLFAMVQNDHAPAEFTMATDSLAIDNSYRHYTKTQVTVKNAGNMLFLTVLYPWVQSHPVVTTMGAWYGAVGNRISDSLQVGYFFAQYNALPVSLPAIATGLQDSLRYNGNLNLFITHPDGSFSGAFIQNGDSLVYGKQPIIGINHKLDVAFEKTADGAYSGFVSGAGIVALFSDRALKVVSGLVTSISYDAARHLNTVTFSGKGNFRLEAANGLAETPGIPGITMAAYPNPAPKGEFVINIDSPFDCRAKLTITDYTGKIVYTRPIYVQPGKTMVRADLSGCPAGSYLLCCDSRLVYQCITLVKSR